jgi:hypothetical protein
MAVSRRSFLGTTPLLALAGAASSRGVSAEPQEQPTPLASSFPTHDSALVRDFVGASHGNVARVKELLQGRPALAKSAWDWGYGDWETALGAASHVGNREIAELLIANGAPVTIFSAAMLGQLEAVQAFVAASPAIHRTKGPHGIPLLAHAQAGKAPAVIKYLESLGGADGAYRNDTVSDEDQAAIVGAYTFGTGATERFTVSRNNRGSLVIQRDGAFERNLFHQGGRVFHPTGAEHVRIRFAPGTPSPELRVEDGPLVVVARRA